MIESSDESSISAISPVYKNNSISGCRKLFQIEVQNVQCWWAYKKGTEISYSKKVDNVSLLNYCANYVRRVKYQYWFVQGERKVFLSVRDARPATVFAF